ncbi:hypothetical protein M3P19_00190 [Muricauda sp. 2012CJ35-5]|uniref:Uncharacterized protein n=1 Tax=Flagellimonas spongiicola TaxID=2942208 RepID=A0ABT0PMC1_9FLAO|nr:hypothetical protein [Allomuricauda spongiicola]MCL6272401.1 hypothetical protein [Allomuricauda spongiicola]
MKNHANFPLITTSLLLLLVTSCQQESNLETNQNEILKKEQLDSKPVILGEELNMPYTVVNMNTAFENLLVNLKHRSKDSKLAKTFKNGQSIEILPSHYYYRFLPKDSLEHDLISRDTILQASNIPLHYQIEEQGDFYDDPELEGDENPDSFSYLYAVVPFDYPIPENIHNERLNDLYFAPEMDDKESLAEGEIMVKQPRNQTTKDILTVDNSGEVFEYLELEALKLTNNLDEEELAALKFYLPNDTSGTLYSYAKAVAKGYQQKDLIIDLASVEAMIAAEQGTTARRRRWSPSGRITVREDVLGRNVGVVGAEVKVRKWGYLVIKRARTNANGNFRTSSTRTQRVKYAVYFNNTRRKFKVMAGNAYIAAKHRGTRTYRRRSWNQNFTWGRSQFYALVHNASHDFYERAVGQFGLKHPNWSWIRINALYNKDAGFHLDLNPLGRYSLIPKCEIRVGRLDGRRPMASDEIYGLVTHEMTHASHYRLDRAFFTNLRSMGCTLQTMAESWAAGVETVVTNDRYLELNLNYSGSNALNARATDDRRLFNSWRQDQIVRHHSKNQYTPIVIDLTDNYNQQEEIRETLPIDRVRDYSLRQIQTSLFRSRGPHTWKERLKNQHVNPTEAFVDELFGVYMYDNCN